MAEVTGIRLVPLMEAIRGAESAAALYARALRKAAAAESVPHAQDGPTEHALYVAVPTAMTVHSRSLFRRESSTVPHAYMESLAPPKDVRFLRLEPEAIARLSSNGRIDVQSFCGALRAHPDPRLQLQGLLRDTVELGPFYLSPSSTLLGHPASGFIPDSLIRYPAATIRVEAENLYADERATPDFEPDPYDLKHLAIGVYVLYQVARWHAEPLAAGETSGERGKKASLELQKRGPGKLFNKTHSPQLAKLIVPGHVRNKGMEGASEAAHHGRAFDPATLAEPRVAAYRTHDDFVNDALSLILDATLDAWPRIREEHSGPGARQHALGQWLEACGFRGKEEIEALCAMIMWPPA